MAPSLRPDADDRPQALRAILGFASHQAFVFYLFYLGVNRAAEAGGFVFERIDLLVALLAMVASFALLHAASPRARGALFAGNLPACYAVLMALGSAIALPTGYGAAAYVVEGALVGLPLGVMLCAWGRALGGRPAANVTPEVLLATALAAGVCLLLALAATAAPWATAVLSLLPFASAWALGGLLGGSAPAAAGRPGKAGAAEAAGEEGGAGAAFPFGDLLATREQRAETARLSKKAVAGTAVFGVAAGCMETYGTDPGMAAAPTFPATLLVLALFCVAALQLVSGAARMADQDAAARAVEAGEGPLNAAYRLALLVMLAGFLFVPVLGPFGVPGESIVLAGYLGLSAVLACLFILMAKLTGIDAAAAFARGFCALYAGEVAGLAAGNVLELAAPSGQAPYAVSACAGLAALVAYQFLFTERDFCSLSVIVREADRFEDACRAISEECGLSKRESEILPLALRGRTGERIAAELFIAKSTVDTHLRRIYTKTGVHGRQELIDLGERTVQRLGGQR